MPERQRPSPNPEYLWSLKDTIAGQWQHLPPAHQASMALVLLADVLAGEHGPWLREAIRLNVTESASPDTVATPPTLHPDHFRHLPRPFQPEGESGDARAQARLVLSGSTRLWYPSAFDGHDLCFGLVVETEITCDYFSLSDLARLRGTDDQPVQPDPAFRPMSLDDLVAHHTRGLLDPPDR